MNHVDLGDEVHDEQLIPPFPQAASRVLAACENPDTKAIELCEILQCDPQLAATVLRVANSSAYGLSGEVRTLRHAVVVLGFKSMRNLALSAAASVIFGSDDELSAARDRLWNHSVGCAVVSSMLAGAGSEVDPDEAFLAGILHDVGKLVLMNRSAPDYSKVIDEATAETVIDIERELFSVDHQEMGVKCSDLWGLPLDISYVIGGHHDVYAENDNPDIVNLVGLADGLTKLWGVGDTATEIDLKVLLRFANLPWDEETLASFEPTAHSSYATIQSAFAS